MKPKLSDNDYQLLRVLFTLAKSLNLPKVLKYAGYMLIKNRPLWIVSKLKGSRDSSQYWGLHPILDVYGWHL